MADFSPVKPKESMESGENIYQFSKVLTIIEDVTQISNKFLVNKHQCERLAARFYVTGEKLKELAKELVGSKSLDAGNQKIDHPAFDLLLTVLKKGKALLSKYIESEASIPSVLTRTENRKAFKEIHADLDIMNSLFHFEDFESTSESERNAMLVADADMDLKDMSESLDELAHHDESRHAAEAAALKNVENVKLVVSEKRDDPSTNNGLPSYLNIDPAIVKISIPVRNPMRKSEHDPVETDGWALVHFGSWLGCQCALKVFSSGNGTWNKSELLKEVCSLMKLHHPHVVQLMGFAQDAEKCIILMELMDTDLRHFMEQRSGNGKRPFTRSEEMDIITQIAEGMYYLHEQQYVHGELKCSNILVKQIGDYIDVKISDLRSSQKLGIWDPVLFKERSTRRRLRWTAPEVKEFGYVGPTHAQLKKTDVYSFGMVCYEVVTGKLPFQDIFDDALKRRVEAGDLKQELPGELDDKLRGLIESCWARDPNDRPTFEEICHLLDYIRSSHPVYTNSFSWIAPVLPLFKWIPLLLGRFRGAEEINSIPLPDFVRIESAKLKIGRSIGKGGYGEVFEATWLGCRFAVKIFNTSLPTEVQRELKFLIELRHPSIVRLMGLSVQSERRWSIVMEFMGGDLRLLIDSRKTGPESVHVPFNLHEAVYIIMKIALGMAFLHSRNVAHRDLKASNVLVPKHPGSIDVKIADFGVSQLIDSGEKSIPVAGTCFWRAPEVFRRRSIHNNDAMRDQSRIYDLKAADVYSFAMTCYEVLTGEVPLEEQSKVYSGAAEVRLLVIAGLRPTLPSDLNSDLKLLIEECWDGEPERRPTFSSICQKLQRIQQGIHGSTSSVY